MFDLILHFHLKKNHVKMLDQSQIYENVMNIKKNPD